MVTKTDVKTFIGLILWALIPSVYMIVRTNIITVNAVDLNIMGQMEWFDLIDEIIRTTLITPLYFLLKDKNSGKNGLTFIISFGAYFLFTVIMTFCIGNIAEFMLAEYAVKYLTLQAVSMLIGFIGTFCNLIFVLYDKYKCIIAFAVGRAVLLAAFDLILISRYKDIGASYSEIVVNTITAAAGLIICFARKIVSAPRKEDADIVKTWLKKGVFCGSQIFLDNFIYAVIVCKMVNAVSGSGNYWVANNFIWGWLLAPISCLARIIQKNALPKLDLRNTWRYVLIVTSIWLVSVFGWKPFLENVMGVADSSPIMKILIRLVPYYLAYNIAAMIDAWFISAGRTVNLFIISAAVNIVYYGFMYILFLNNVFALTIDFVIDLFGIGMVIHAIIAVGLYIAAVRKNANKKTAIK